jgi:uncharacterized protein (TIGR00255 family)
MGHGMSVVSMTGFGRAEGVSGATRWIWEARSVNGRGLDVRARLPAGFDAFESAAREAAQKRFRRGSVQVTLTLRREATAAPSAVNTALVEQLLAAGAAHVKTGLVAPPRWDGLLMVRGVLSGDVEDESAEARAALEASLTAGVAAAFDALERTRRQEGASLAATLSALLDRIEHLTIQARTLAAAQPEAMIERLRARVAAAAPDVQVDPQRLAQEAALAAARADVREELDRLAAHAQEARSLLSGAEPAGRRLDFLAQEFNREANTLCSKSSDLALTRLGLDLKTTIDQLREQSANVE